MSASGGLVQLWKFFNRVHIKTEKALYDLNNASVWGAYSELSDRSVESFFKDKRKLLLSRPAQEGKSRVHFLGILLQLRGLKAAGTSAFPEGVLEGARTSWLDWIPQFLRQPEVVSVGLTHQGRFLYVPAAWILLSWRFWCEHVQISRAPGKQRRSARNLKKISKNSGSSTRANYMPTVPHRLCLLKIHSTFLKRNNYIY